MINRFLRSAAITLALTLTPGLAFSTPTQSVEKRSQKAEKIAKKSKPSKGSKTYRSCSARGHSEDNEVVESSVAPSYTRSGVSETAPLMKVTPQRDGKFLLEPLTAPKKTITPAVAAIPPGGKSAWGSSTSRGYNASEPWDFSQLVLSKAQAYRHTPYARGVL